jgi:MFS family permease
MSSILKPFIALYTAALFLMMSLGLLTTFVSLKLTMEGISTQVAGLIVTSYFIGVIVGSLYCKSLIKSVGHIRSFCAFAAIITSMVMLHGLYMSPVAWAVFRFFSGIAVIGLFMVIESWLNECSQSDTRGRIFSIYMILCYLGNGIGQQFLNFGDVKDQTLFFVIGFLLMLCVIPVSLTRSIHPDLPEVEPIRLKQIFQKAPLGILGCFTAGLVNSSFYTMGPIFCHKIGLSVSQVSNFMTITVLGGLLLQWPVGAFSDRFDRSIVMPVIGGIFSLISCFMLLAAQQISFTAFLTVTAIFGGFMFTIYPTAVARAHDMFEPRDVVNVSSALLLFFGIGAVIGPLISSSVIEFIDNPYGFYAYFTCISVIFTIVAYILRKKEIARSISIEDQVDYMIMKDTSQMAMQIDPRSESEHD